MRAVLDSCVALKTVLPEIDTRRPSLVIEYRVGLHHLLADIFPVEIATRCQVRATWHYSATDGCEAAPRGDAQLTGFASLHPAPASGSCHRLGRPHWSLNDCLYVALAEREGCEWSL